MEIYQPAEDSFLLSKSVEEYLKDKPKNLKILDMGSGSGIQARTCKVLGFKNIITTDLKQSAVKELKKEFKTKKSDLFSNIKRKFDLIIFNPPYLPEDKREPLLSKLATTGGKQGYEIINKFLEQATNHLTKKGIIFLVFSSLSKPKTILKKAKPLYSYKLIEKQEIPNEKLLVYSFRLKVLL